MGSESKCARRLPQRTRGVTASPVCHIPTNQAGHSIINAEKSDLFDVLAYVAYALPPLTTQVATQLADATLKGRKGG